ncbi:MAG: aldo/keto reductase [Treponema sp.]|jgi:aryl-alcohol dehydrogenase-like predicted oxidoreductase|nr:aldo/keto reductase [Treponema sp.]
MLQETVHKGLFFSRIGIGCWPFGGGAYWGDQDQEDVNAVVHAAIERGINVFDTARMYNDGASEISLGKALKGCRDKAFVISKVSPAKAYRKTLREELEASLKCLGLDYIDMYMLHWPINPKGLQHFTNDPAILANPPSPAEAFETLAALKTEGKIRYIGISNFGIKQTTEAAGLCPDIAANEMPYNIISRAIEAEVIPFCTKQNIAVITSMTLQQGVLTGLYKNASEVPAHQAHSRHFSMETGRGNSRHHEAGAEAEVFETVAFLKELAPDLGLSVAQLSIAWVLANPLIACALIGSRNVKELDENVKVLSVKLPAGVKEKIDKVSLKVLGKLGNNPDYYENSKESRIF